MTLEETIFGRGIGYPLEADVNGRLVERSGSDLLWDSVEAVIDNPPGSAPLDPTWGYGLEPYQTLDQIPAECHRLGEAIVAADPRISALHIEILSASGLNNQVSLRITITPTATQVPESRVYPYFGLAV